ncbi:MAG: hypothetical protein ACUZ8H_03660 [Candidatus Anammoxibacter sp.]
MTKLLEKAITKVHSLSSDKQDFIASVILEELEDELEWDQAFNSSQPQLAKIAEKVREDIKAGKIKKTIIESRGNSKASSLTG